MRRGISKPSQGARQGVGLPVVYATMNGQAHKLNAHSCEGALEGHWRGTRGALEGHWRGTGSRGSFLVRPSLRC